MSSGEDRIRVLIVDDIPETRENLKKMLYFESDMEVVGTASTGEEAIELAKQVRPHVVLMDINMPGVDGIAASEAITRAVPYAQVVMMSVQSEADYLRRSMLAGARDFLTKPFTMDDLVATVRRVYQLHAKPAAEAPSAQPVAPQAVDHQPESLGRVILVYSPKGGVGCTTIAVNLATMMLELEPESRVALVDASLQFGDVGVLLNLRATRSIVNLADNLEEMDRELLESALLTDDRSGLRVLLAPPKPEMAEFVTAEAMKQITELMRRAFDYVVIDLGKRLQDLELLLFDMADQVILLIAPTLPSIKDARNFFEIMDALEYGVGKTLLVLNQSDAGAGITARAIENHLRHEVFAEIPRDDRIVLHSVNHGIPYVLIPNLDRRHPLMEQTRVLTERVLGAFAEMVEEKGEQPPERPLRRLFR
jgi:pilus assembly protein CpaE